MAVYKDRLPNVGCSPGLPLYRKHSLQMLLKNSIRLPRCRVVSDFSSLEMKQLRRRWFDIEQPQRRSCKSNRCYEIYHQLDESALKC